MADKNKTNQTAEPRKKADVILEKLDVLLNSSTEMINRTDKAVASSNYISRQNSEIYERTLEENANLRQQIKYIATQSQSVYDKMTAMLAELTQKVEALQHAVESSSASAVAEEVVSRIDYEVIADNIEEVLTNGGDAGYMGASDNSEVLYEAKELAEGEEEPDDIDYDAIADRVCERMTHITTDVELDYDLLAEKVLQGMLNKEEVSVDYMASKVAEQIIIPDPDYDMIADAVFDRLYADDEDLEEELDDGDIIEEEYIPDEEELRQFAEDENSVPEYEPVDCDRIAELVVEKLTATDEEYDYETFDYEKLADSVAEKIFHGDEQGEEIEEEETLDFDYDKLAEAIVAKIDIAKIAQMAVESADGAEKPAEEVDLTENTLSQVVDEISKRVCECLPADFDIVVDDAGCEILANAVSEKLDMAIADDVAKKLEPSEEDKAESASSTAKAITEYLSEYDIIMNADGVEEIKNGVAQSVTERFDKLESDVREIKEMLKAGVVVAADELAASDALAEDDSEDGELVTVSDLIGSDEPAEESQGEVLQEQPEENSEEEVSDEETEENSDEESGDVIEEIVQEIDEKPADGEVMPDGMDGVTSVDFANMMKYNRSFIARIIQGDDNVKTYYGQTKTALLSYKRVNSNVAWGAERFNFGRETIAKFKIRGKTLCLYLALDPNEYKTSVYHHADVSDNKSMATTPMMVKIKSPLGVKKAIRLIDDMLEKRGALKQNVVERDYVAMYPYQTIDELIEDGLVKDISKNN